eukprot:TRINITY_DN5070_c0_g1_i1.p1 TRINITY_DN5070_c0_g1~~TRINITY_DN5070_c0_g1_i1.p1  ORF type:complete len:267 (-),score=5.89 TRINITY_DN5070_c0_g1_i1:9-809(-)
MRVSVRSCRFLIGLFAVFTMTLMFRRAFLLSSCPVKYKLEDRHPQRTAQDVEMECLERGDYFAHEEFLKAGSDECTTVPHPELTEDSIVFEVGGNRGDFVALLLNHYRGIVYIFEPVAQYYLHLVERFSGNPKIRVFSFGLSDKDELVNIVKFGFKAEASSVFYQDTNGSFPTETIVLRSMSSVLQNFNVTKVDLLNINCEGCEYPVLEHVVEKNLVTRFSGIQVQFHRGLVTDQLQRKCRLEALLHNTHFEVFNFNYVWQFWYKR